MEFLFPTCIKGEYLIDAMGVFVVVGFLVTMFVHEDYDLSYYVTNPAFRSALVSLNRLSFFYLRRLKDMITGPLIGNLRV